MCIKALTLSHYHFLSFYPLISCVEAIEVSMMKSNSFCGYSLIITFFMLFLGARSMSRLTPNFYGKTCPNLFTVVKNEVQKAFDKENRMAASLLRLHFHDCFVNVSLSLNFFCQHSIDRCPSSYLVILLKKMS
jgi:hypothetical protein